jgi:hypothetical protein
VAYRLTFAVACHLYIIAAYVLSSHHLSEGNEGRGPNLMNDLVPSGRIIIGRSAQAITARLAPP